FSGLCARAFRLHCVPFAVSPHCECRIPPRRTRSFSHAARGTAIFSSHFLGACSLTERRFRKRRLSACRSAALHTFDAFGHCFLFHNRACHVGAHGIRSYVYQAPGGTACRGNRFHLRCVIYADQRRAQMNARNKVIILLSIIFAIALGYYLLSTPRGSDLDLTGTVDANQVIVSPQVQGRISKLLVDEGTRVNQGDLIAVLDPSELEAQARAAAAMIDSLRSQVAATQATSVATKGSTTSSVANAQAQLESARAQLLQAEATLQRVESDSRRTIELAKQGVSSDQERVQAEANLKAQQAVVASLQQQVTAAQAGLNSAIANTHQASAAQSTVASTRGQLLNSEAQLKEAEVRLGY